MPNSGIESKQNERKIDEIIKLMKEILNNGIKISD